MRYIQQTVYNNDEGTRFWINHPDLPKSERTNGELVTISIPDNGKWSATVVK